MNTTIENQLFRAFDKSIMPLCIMYLQHKYDLKYSLPINTTNQSDSSVYTEKFPKAIEKQLDLFDESIMDDGFNSSLMNEIRMNLEECTSDANKRKRYLISLITPFRELSDILTPSVSISRIEKEKEYYKNDYKDWLDSVSSPKEKQEVKDACANKMKELDDMVDRAIDIETGFLNILNCIDYEPESVEESFKYLVRLYRNYAVLLDALLLTFGIDLLSLQDECNIHILHRRNTTLIAFHLGSMEIAQRYIDELPKIDLNKNKFSMPEELRTLEAQEILNKAINAKFMIQVDSGYKWLLTKELLAYFCCKCSLRLGLRRGKLDKNGEPTISWKPFEELFNEKRISSGRDSWMKLHTTFHPNGYETIDLIFE